MILLEVSWIESLLDKTIGILNHGLFVKIQMPKEELTRKKKQDILLDVTSLDEFEMSGTLINGSCFGIPAILLRTIESCYVFQIKTSLNSNIFFSQTLGYTALKTI